MIIVLMYLSLAGLTINICLHLCAIFGFYAPPQSVTTLMYPLAGCIVYAAIIPSNRLKNTLGNEEFKNRFLALRPKWITTTIILIMMYGFGTLLFFAAKNILTGTRPDKTAFQSPFASIGSMTLFAFALLLFYTVWRISNSETDHDKSI